MKYIYCLLGLFAIALLCGATIVAAESPPTLALYPPTIDLNGAAARQSVLVVATRSDGVTEDVTTKAKLSLAASGIARLERALVIPQADGTTRLTAQYGGQTISVPVAVHAATKSRDISFKLDVMPVFMRSGCNTGGCHGSARGQDGFRLSLFGFDPDGDHHRLTRELGPRRINLAEPEQSLLVEKALGTVPHTGGKRFEPGSVYHRTLVEWLHAGAPADPGEVPAVENVEIYPPQVVLDQTGAKQELLVRAKYADGTCRDVTHLAVFLTNNDHAAPVDASGLVAAAHPGEAFVMARFSTFTVGSQVLVLPPAQGYKPPQEKPVNYIDELVGTKLRKLRIAPAPLCSDEVFLRRVTLDICGHLPTANEFRQFQADPPAERRTRLIDRLLARKEFAEIWAMNWAELLMIRSTVELSYKSTFLYANWLTEQIARGVPIDQMVRELLCASGGTFRNPPTNFYQVERDTLKTAENVAQTFMGIRIQCAQCHNHPFDRWTLNDYYGFAAFFSQVGRKQAEDYRETLVFNRNSGDVRHPVTNRSAPPKFLGGGLADVKDQDRREVFARWLTAPDNPYFAASLANRVWAFFFGRGIVEPVDDFRASNPPSNPELLDGLRRRLVDYHYDFRRLVRDICTSRAYQSATRPDAEMTAVRNFAVASPRRLRAEILLDCISQVTEAPEKFRGLPQGARAVEIADGTTSNYFLTTFGRSPRESACACDVRTEPTLSQALHLLNGETLQRKIAAGKVVAQMVQAKQPPQAVLRELYIRCLTREPEPAELSKLLPAVAAASDRRQALEDVFWALLNSREFVFNH